MFGSTQQAVWLFVLLAEFSFVVCALFRRDFLRYLSLNLYMLLCVIANVGVYVCSRTYSIHSREYFYSYYSSDILLSVLMYFVIAGLFSQVFAGTEFGRYVRGAAGILLGLTVLFSYISALHSGSQLTAQFAVELEQDLNFVGVILIYVLWGSVIRFRETRVRLVQLVLALGVYFSAVAGTFALFNLFPDLKSGDLRLLPQLIALWLPLAWTYTFARIPDNARLSPGHTLVTSH
jgi:hypothetical protein